MNSETLNDPWQTSALAALQSVTTVFRDVAPLPSQIGVGGKRTVPDALDGAIFGGPWASSLVVVDAALFADPRVDLDRHGRPHACLFDGGRMSDVAPWLVMIERGDRFVRNLFTSRSKNGEYDARRCLFLRSDLPMAEVRASLRKLTKVRDESGRWLFLRFWDPLFAEYLLRHGSDGIQYRLLSAGPVIFAGAEPGAYQMWSQVGDVQRPSGALRLEARDFHALALARMDAFCRRLLAWLKASYGRLPEGLDPWRFVQELSFLAQNRHGLGTEREISDYVAASWLLRAPVERFFDMRPVGHEIPQATMARLHDMAYAAYGGNDGFQKS